MSVEYVIAPTRVYVVQRKSNGWYAGREIGAWHRRLAIECLHPTLESAQRMIVAMCSQEYELGHGFREPPSGLRPSMMVVLTFELRGPL